MSRQPARPARSARQARSVTIKHDRFKCTLVDTNAFFDLPVVNTRKLWRYMFTHAWDNEGTIEQINEWLPVAAAETKSRLHATELNRKEKTVKREAAHKKSEIANAKVELDNAKAEFTTAKADYSKMQKLQIIYSELYQKHMRKGA